MQVKIVPAILFEGDHRHTQLAQRPHVWATRGLVATHGDTKGLQHLVDSAHIVEGAVGNAGVKAPNFTRAKIRFGADDVLI